MLKPPSLWRFVMIALEDSFTCLAWVQDMTAKQTQNVVGDSDEFWYLRFDWIFCTLLLCNLKSDVKQKYSPRGQGFSPRLLGSFCVTSVSSTSDEPSKSLIGWCGQGGQQMTVWVVALVHGSISGVCRLLGGHLRRVTCRQSYLREQASGVWKNICIWISHILVSQAYLEILLLSRVVHEEKEIKCKGLVQQEENLSSNLSSKLLRVAEPPISSHLLILDSDHWFSKNSLVI